MCHKLWFCSAFCWWVLCLCVESQFKKGWRLSRMGSCDRSLRSLNKEEGQRSYSGKERTEGRGAGSSLSRCGGEDSKQLGCTWQGVFDWSCCKQHLDEIAGKYFQLKSSGRSGRGSFWASSTGSLRDQVRQVFTRGGLVMLVPALKWAERR